MITANKDRLQFTQQGGNTTLTVEFGSPGNYSVTVVYDAGSTGWITYTTQQLTSTSFRYTITAQPSNMSVQRSGRFTFSFIKSGAGESGSNDDRDSLVVPFYQGGGYRAIWKDYLLLPDAARGQNYKFSFKQDNNEIYRGITMAPNALEYPEYVNAARIMESYVESSDFDIEFTENEWYELNSTEADFYKIDSSGNDVFKEAMYFFGDWSGKTSLYYSDTILNDPINDHACSPDVGDMTFPFCIYNASNSEHWGCIAYMTPSKSQSQQWEFSEPPYPFDIVNVPNDIYRGINSIAFKHGEKHFYEYDLSYCGNGCLYYRNRFGGWDVFLIEGNISRTDSFSKDQYTKFGLNYLRNSWNKVTDTNTITVAYEMSTGWLTDDEAERLSYHLLSSPVVYFKPFDNERYEYDSGSLISVNITNSNAEYKKFRNGRNLIRYTITMEESKQKRVRK